MNNNIRDSILNRLQVCTLGLQKIVDFPDATDANQRTAANVAKQLAQVAAEVRELCATDVLVEEEGRI